SSLEASRYGCARTYLRIEETSVHTRRGGTVQGFGSMVQEALVLRRYQHEGIKFLQDASRAILGDDRGLGKTAQALKAGRVPMLIVCAHRLMGKWRDEVLLKWRPEWGEVTVICDQNTREKRNDALLRAQSMQGIAIINYEML